MNRSCSQDREGSALALTIVILVVLECVVLGTVHLSLLERRLATNANTVLQLRLAADGAAAAAAAAIDGAVIRMLPVAHPLTVPAGNAPPGITIDAAAERLRNGLILVRARASLTPPRHGAATAALLVTAPALPLAHVRAALHAPAFQTVGAGTVSAAAPSACTEGIAALVSGFPDMQPGVDGVVIAAPPGQEPEEAVQRVLAAPDRGAAARIDGDWILSDSATGVYVVRGNARLLPGTTFVGLLVTAGTIVIEEGASFTGSIFASSHVETAGAVHADLCIARAAAAAALLHIAVPVAGRARLPAFH